MALLPSVAVAAESHGYRNFLKGLSQGSDSPYLPILCVFGVLLTLGTFFKPRFGLVVMLFFIMISTDMPIGRDASAMGGRSVTVRIEDIILLIVSAGWLLNRARTRSLSLIKSCPLYAPILAMSFVIVVATIVGYFQGTVPAMRGFFFTMKRLEYFWIFFMVFNILDTDKEGRVAVFILFAASVIMAVICSAQFFFFPVSELASGGATGVSGYGRANTVGDFLLIVIGLSAGFVICNQQTRWAPLLNCLLAVFLLALFMTKSRGAYVSMPPLILTLLFISKSRKMLLLLISCAIIAVLYSLLSNFITGDTRMLFKMLNSDIHKQFSSIGDVATKGEAADSSLHARVVAWQAAVDEVVKYPLLGQGCGAKQLGNYDNQYVSEIVDTGMIGLTTFLFMNAMLFLFMWRYYRITDSPYPRALTLGFMGGHAGILVHAITITNFYTIFNMEVFWFVIAIICLFFHNECQRRQTTISEPVKSQTQPSP